MRAFLSVATLLLLPVIAADLRPSNSKLGPFFDSQQAAMKIDASGLHADLRGRALATGKKDHAVAASKDQGGKKKSVSSGKKGDSSGKKGISSESASSESVSSGKKGDSSSGKKGASSVKKDTKKKGSEKEAASGKKRKGKKSFAGSASSVNKDAKKKSSKKEEASGKKRKGKKSFAGKPIDPNFGVSDDRLPDGVPPQDDATLPPDEAPPLDDATLPPDGIPPQDDATLPPDEATPQDDATLPPDEAPPQDDATLPPDEATPQDDATLPPDEAPPQDDASLPPDEAPPSDDASLPPSPNFETQFAMLRSQVGSPDVDSDGAYRLASSIGVNGFITEIIYTLDGERTVGQEVIGEFKGACTMISKKADSLICTYQITLTQNQTGVIITTGKVTGAENEALVTGAAFDFAGYNGGVLTTIQDSEKPIMYSYLSLF